jgi:fructose/tagatose bisphosphate aldolase
MGSMDLRGRSWIIPGESSSYYPQTRLYIEGLFFLLTETDRNRLEAIRKQVAGRVRIVLHGTNGFADEVTQRCIAGGVSKINVNKLVLEDYNSHLKSHASKLPQTQLIDEGVRHVVRMQEYQMDVCGSSGKA